jgi:hypothetical protein
VKNWQRASTVITEGRWVENFLKFDDQRVGINRQKVSQESLCDTIGRITGTQEVGNSRPRSEGDFTYDHGGKFTQTPATTLADDVYRKAL